MPSARVREVTGLLRRGASRNLSSDMVRRARKDSTEKQDTALTPQHSAKTKQAWRYSGGNIVRAPSTRLGSAVYTDPKDPGMPRRKQESNFFLTINTNKAPVGDELELGIKHANKMLARLSAKSALATYLKYGPKDPVYATDKYADVIKSVSWNGAVETGDKQRRLHAHVWLTITHYSQIQINVRMLMQQARKFYNEGLPLGSSLRITAMPYVHVKLLPQSNWTDVMRQYVHKAMTVA